VVSAPLPGDEKPSVIRTLYARLHEPRVKRLFQFGIYALTSVGGLVAFLSLPTMLVAVIGHPMTATFGAFGFIGSVLSMVSVIGDIAWLERVGLLLLLTAVVMYGCFMLLVGGVPVALFLVGALGISLVQRLIEIRHE
jgi:hypothetical protein